MVSKELVAASNKPLILSILKQGDSYGYEIIQRVRELSNDELAWTDGMLYPVLHRLENEDFIRSYWKVAPSGRKRKYYSLQRPGLDKLEEERRQWTTVHKALESLWEPGHSKTHGAANRV